ncbi:MAG: adenosylcobinamide-GDP ribazoletransferase [Actinomycetota bacterium]|nr:adenosylcobinamide-GDP ribazoletransferase [Actinomycetota bacterium]
MPDALRLAIGTLTRLPVPAPTALTRRSTAWAMSLAPVIGAALALLCGLPLLIDATPVSALLLAALSIALLAFATRGLHLDGLADTADALGSGKPAAQALAIARKSDIGPFGVITLVLNLLLQIVSLAVCLTLGDGLLALLLAVVVGRICLSGACTGLWLAARTDGLGANVAGSVPIAVPVIWSLVFAITAFLALGGAGLASTLLALAVAQVVLVIAKRRLGGITGDVLGAVIECSTTTVLITLALLLPI